MALLRAAVFAALVSTSGFALDTSKLKPRGYVNDFAGALDARSAQALEAYKKAIAYAPQAEAAEESRKYLGTPYHRM